MLSPFENIIIGNFLFGLGLVMGNKPRQVDACVNLLQQTPLDKVLGDVMLQFPGSWRLIEFKRRGANLKKEKVKLATYRGATSRDRELRAASMRAHWFVESGEFLVNQLDNQEFQIKVRPYLDLEEGGGISLEDFAAQVAADAHGGAPHQREMDLYLRLITLFGCLDGYQTSGLLVGIKSGGGLVYLPLENITDLKSTCRLLRARLRAREREFAPEQARRGPFSQAVKAELNRRQDPFAKSPRGSRGPATRKSTSGPDTNATEKDWSPPCRPA